MTDLSKTIAPRSDQLNCDDLITGPRTVAITKVVGMDDAQQPIAIHFNGDDGKPYKPCLSMRRVMVHAWGKDGNTYAGHSLTLFRDPEVSFGGIKTGGIRISHMSHIDREMVVPLMVTKGKRQPYKVSPLRGAQQAPKAPTPEAMDADFHNPPHDPLRVPMGDLNPDHRVGWVEAFKARCLREKTPSGLMEVWRTYYDLQLTPLYGIDRELYDGLERWFSDRMKRSRDAETK